MIADVDLQDKGVVIVKQTKLGVSRAIINNVFFCHQNLRDEAVNIALDILCKANQKKLDLGTRRKTEVRKWPEVKNSQKAKNGQKIVMEISPELVRSQRLVRN